MAFVITAPCISEKNQACVDVCPVDCIKTIEYDDQCFIDPEECIDCGACELGVSGDGDLRAGCGARRVEGLRGHQPRVLGHQHL